MLKLVSQQMTYEYNLLVDNFERLIDRLQFLTLFLELCNGINIQ